MARRSLVIMLFLLAVGAFAVFRPAVGPEAAMPEALGGEPAVRLTVETVQPEPIILQAEHSGRVAAGRRVEIRPQVGGLILERHVEEGARVSAGDVLFSLDPAPLKADLVTAEAALARAETAEDHARRAAERSDALVAKKAVSQERNDAVHTDLRLATAAVAEARAVVERRTLDLDFATIRSPIDGHVTAGLADVGALASSASDRALAVVHDLETVLVDLRVPAGGIGAILAAAREGLGPVRILPDRAGAEAVTGVVKFSDQIVDPGTGYVTVRVEAANPDHALLPGMFVHATLPRGSAPEAILAPEEAVLRTGDGGTQLVVVSPEGEATRRDVRLGDRVGYRVIVTSGLEAGETVAIQGQDRVPEGRAVRAAAHLAHASSSVSEF